jgi:bacteriocin-like protein
MNTKNLTSQIAKTVNHLTIKNLPAELVELSEKDLQQVVGGREPIITILIIGFPDSNPRQTDSIFQPAPCNHYSLIK